MEPPKSPLEFIANILALFAQSDDGKVIRPEAMRQSAREYTKMMREQDAMNRALLGELRGLRENVKSLTRRLTEAEGPLVVVASELELIGDSIEELHTSGGEIESFASIYAGLRAEAEAEAESESASDLDTEILDEDEDAEPPLRSPLRV